MNKNKIWVFLTFLEKKRIKKKLINKNNPRLKKIKDLEKIICYFDYALAKIYG